MIGLMPAEVDSIDREARIAKVRIPGLTDGATDLPEAQFCNSIGDKSEHTEIRVKPNDRVWLAFVGNDPRYPVIVGFRPRQQENGIDWRRFEHANFQFTADGEFIIDAGAKVTINTKQAIVNASEKTTVVSPEVLIDSAQATCTGALTVKGPFTYQAGMSGKGNATMSGNMEMSGGSLKHNGKNVGGDHLHDGVKAGTDKSGGPT